MQVSTKEEQSTFNYEVLRVRAAGAVGTRPREKSKYERYASPGLSFELIVSVNPARLKRAQAGQVL
jgi:hypothetical protein